MVYRVNVNLTFPSREIAEALFGVIAPYWGQTTGATGGFVNESAQGVLEECHHDEVPPAPCKIIRSMPEE